MRLRHFVVVLTFFCLSAGLASGQVLYGNLVGNITDPQQAAVVGASVSIKSKATGFSQETKTDDRGAYEIVNIPPGVYDIKMTAAGFSTYEAQDITIQANNIARVDAPLRVGSVTEVITVGAEVALLQTDKSDIHTDIASQQLTQVAVAGYRNFQSLLDLVPGVMPSAFQNASTDSPARALTTNVNGTARNSNNTRIDGAANVFTWLPHHAFYIPPMESIETVNIATNNFDAEQGMAGGAAVSVITKSGTNRYHGVVFEYTANHKWGAKNLFFNPNTPAGPGIPQRIDNQFGGTFGGPIKKDKLFFFTSWEQTTTAERGNGLLSVPTAQVRSGNFNGLTTVYDPATGNPADGTGRTPFPGNIVPEARWSAAARTLQGFIPSANTGSGQTANFFAVVPYYFKRNLVDGKLNWTPNNKINVFGKYSVMLSPVSAQAPLGDALGAYPGGAAGDAGIGTGHNHTDIFGGGVSYVISPTLLFDANFGGTRMHHDTTGPDYGKNIGLEVLKIPGTNGSDIRQSGFPIFNISGYTGLGNQNNWSPVVRNDRQYTYAANLNWSKGAHSLRFGIDLIKHEMNHWQPELLSYSPRGGFNFVNGVTGLNGGPAPNNFNAYASFLLGLPGSFGKSYQFYDPMQTREFQQGYYIRDNWQVTRKLSVNLGLRLEHFPIMDRGQYGIERYDPDTNKVLIGGRGNVPRTAGTDAIAVMFAPRIGLAYRVNEKTVFRAGYGITRDPYPTSRPLRSPYPAVIVADYQPANSFVPAGSLATGIPNFQFPDLSSGIIDIPNSVATNTLQPGTFRRGYIESYNVTIQREIGAGFVLQTGYAGTHSVRQDVTYFEANAGLVPGAGANGRPLFLKYGVNSSRSVFIPMANQRYDGWQTNLTRRFSQGLFLTSSYTWSKAIGINAGNSDSGLRFYVPSQFSKNKSVADFDRTHSWVTAANWEAPFGKNKKFATQGAGAAILGGWQLNPNVALYTGRPFLVGTDGSSLNAPQNTQVADQIKGDVQKFGGVGLGAPFYDPTAFATVSQARFGNMGLNAIRGPRLFNMNLGLFRKFQFGERFDLQFRAEALNLTNTPSLSQPNATASTPSNFMAITSTITTATSPQRTIRFGLRLAF
jgi:hypothetical protein